MALSRFCQLTLLFLCIPAWIYADITFPFLFQVERNGKKTYINYLKKWEFHELTDRYYVGMLGERRWVGPDDLFLEYEMYSEWEVEQNDTLVPVTNTSRCIAWFIPDEKQGTLLVLKVTYDHYRKGDNEWEETPDTDWRRVGPISSMRMFNELLDIFYQTYIPPAEASKLSFPFLFEENNDGSRTFLYDLKDISFYPDIASLKKLETKESSRSITPEDIFLEYEMMDDRSFYQEEEFVPAGNLYRCRVCFTNNGEWNSEVYIQILSDNWWEGGEKWETPPDTGWRYVGYLNEISTFLHLYNAFRKYKSIL